MNRTELRLRYKAETSNTACDEVECEFEVWRSKGQWVLNMSDAEKFELSGRAGMIRFIKPDEDYLLWLEEKVMDLLT